MNLPIELIHKQAIEIVEKFGDNPPYCIEVEAVVLRDEEGVINCTYWINLLEKSGSKEVISGYGETPSDALLSFQANCLLKARPIE